MKLHSPTQRIGVKAEKFAYRYLKKQGLKLVTHNFASPFGEIDLIMREGVMLVFIEVRYRRNDTHGNSCETINVAKQRRIIRSAHYYLQIHPTCASTRFDVIAISSLLDESEINWIKDAFQVK